MSGNPLCEKVTSEGPEKATNIDCGSCVRDRIPCPFSESCVRNKTVFGARARCELLFVKGACTIPVHSTGAFAIPVIETAAAKTPVYAMGTSLVLCWCQQHLQVKKKNKR